MPVVVTTDTHFLCVIYFSNGSSLLALTNSI
ncbi:MAG: hypothetical protein RL642_317 [Bacteroidota bacterium]